MKRWFGLMCLLVACPWAGHAWTFVVIGDHRGDGTNTTPDHPWVNTPVVQALAQQAVAVQPALVLLLGDMIHNWPESSPSPAEQLSIFTNAFAAVPAAGIPVYAVRGNHEMTRMLDGAAFLQAFPQNPLNGPTGEVGLTFSVAFSNALFVGLDEFSDYSVIRHVNQDWLDAQISTYPRLHLFVFGHTTVFALADETTLATYPDERDDLWRCLAQAGCRLFFGAHVHVYDRARVAVDAHSPAIWQLVVGAGGAPFWPVDFGHYPDLRAQHQYGVNEVYGYLWVDVDGNRVRVEYRGTTNLVDWSVYDAFDYVVASGLNDFDGDRKADPAIYRGSDGLWKVALSGSDYQERLEVETGLAGWTPVPGDYDGDRLTDVAAYDRLSRQWLARFSSSGLVVEGWLGGPEFTVAQCDFDGDTLTDLFVYREADGYWLGAASSRQYAQCDTSLGETGYQSMVADYDGDGLADPAVYNRTTGLWVISLSGRGYQPLVTGTFGGSGYLPATADYDGDGLADPAIYAPGTAHLQVLFSGSLATKGYYTWCDGFLGSVGGLPVPADYDGDGLADPAVYHQDTSRWELFLSTQGYQLCWGLFGGPEYSPVTE